jgi:hypothetical protein
MVSKPAHCEGQKQQSPLSGESGLCSCCLPCLIGGNEAAAAKAAAPQPAPDA